MCIRDSYRAMDLLLEVEDTLAEQVFWATATLLDLEVDLVFFDTSSTYFERDTADDPISRDERGEPAVDGGQGVGEPVGFRTYGHSKDHREDLPQVVIGMAVTRTGIPIRTWCWPGNTADTSVMGQVRADLRDWKLTRVVWVTDRGFSSAENRRLLQRGGSHYIQAEKLRGSAEGEAALARPGRYRTVAGNLRIKEIKPRHEQGVMTDRFIVCHNPDQADRDAAIRERLVAQLSEKIERSDGLSKTKRAELRGKISTMPGLNRYLRTIPGGLLRLDAKAIPAEVAWTGSPAALLGPALSGEDIALGYKQLLEVERGWRDLKTTPHPRARAAVLAGAAPGPGRGEHHRAHLGAPARGDLAAARRGVPKAPPDASGALSSPPPSATSSPPCESTHATKIIEIAEAEPPDQAQHSAWTRVRPGGDHAFPQLTAPSPVQLTCQLRSAGQVNLLYLI